MSVGDHHDLIVEKIVGAGYSTGSLRKPLQDLFITEDLLTRHEARELVGHVVGGFRPDAWKIDRDDRNVIWVEVDCSCFLTPGKWNVLVSLGSELDALGWDLVLKRVDQFGVALDFPVDGAWVWEMAGIDINPKSNPGAWMGELQADEEYDQRAIDSIVFPTI